MRHRIQVSLNDATPIEGQILDYLAEHSDKRQAVLRTLLTIGYATLIKRMSDSEALLAAADPVLLAALVPHLTGAAPPQSRKLPSTPEPTRAPVLTTEPARASAPVAPATPIAKEPPAIAPVLEQRVVNDEEALADFPPEVEIGEVPEVPVTSEEVRLRAMDKIRRMGALDDEE